MTQHLKPLEQRVGELEVDVLRVIDQLMDTVNRLEQHEAHLKSLIRGLLEDSK